MGLTTDRNDGCLYETDPLTGQNKCYLILPDGDRKELVLPVRTTYRHLKCGTNTTMGRPIAETYAANPTGFYTHTFCVQCRRHLPVGEFVWTQCDAEGEGTLVGTINVRPK